MASAVHLDHGRSSLTELRTLTVRDLATLELHRAAWEQLARDAPQRLPTLLPSWIDAVLRYRLKEMEHWLCCFAYEGDRLVGVLPVIVTPHWLMGSSWPTLRTPFDAHTPSGDVVLAPDHAGPAFRALLAEIRHQLPHHLALDLKAIRKSSPVWTVLQDELDGYVRRWGPRHMYSFLDVQGDYESYFAGLGKMRRNLRLGRKKLESRGAVSVELRKGAAASEDFLSEFLALEASGWKGRNGTAILNDPKDVAFYTTLVRNFAAQGGLEWHIMRVREHVVAAQMGVRCGASLMLPKFAFNEEFAECTPGHLLMEEVIREAHHRHELIEINPMSDAPQHRLFRMPRDEYVDVHLVRRSILPMLFQLPPITVQSAYHTHIQPHIPAIVKEAHRKLKRRRERKPRRAAAVK